MPLLYRVLRLQKGQSLATKLLGFVCFIGMSCIYVEFRFSLTDQAPISIKCRSLVSAPPNSPNQSHSESSTGGIGEFIEKTRHFVMAVSLFNKFSSTSHLDKHLWNFQGNSEDFDPQALSRAHRWDKLSEDDWIIIYRDLGASRTYFLAALGLPLVLIC